MLICVTVIEGMNVSHFCTILFLLRRYLLLPPNNRADNMDIAKCCCILVLISRLLIKDPNVFDLCVNKYSLCMKRYDLSTCLVLTGQPTLLTHSLDWNPLLIATRLEP